MKLVINIPDEEYKRVMDGKWEGNPLADYIKNWEAQLPEGYVKLIYANDVGEYRILKIFQQ